MLENPLVFPEILDRSNSRVFSGSIVGNPPALFASARESFAYGADIGLADRLFPD